jgi:shikimate kinase
MSGIHKIYIIGFMGSGKTTAGKRLASSLGWSFADLDKKIEEQTGFKIPEIFSKHGEDQFRITEAEILRTLMTDTNTVISTGGGTPCYGSNMEFMLDTGLTLYLKMTPAQLAGRLSGSTDERPLLKNLSGVSLLKFIEEKLAIRSEWYEKSHLIVDGFDLDLTILNSIVETHLRLM